MKITFEKTKIVATVGPASNTKEMLRALIEAGVDVFRLNFSHGTHQVHQQVINFIRELNHEMGTHVAMLQDLQGPKIRVEEVEKGVVLEPGAQLVITTQNVVGNASRVSTSYQAFAGDVAIGDTIMINDGKIELRAIAKTDTDVTAEVVYGGELTSRKGINLPMTEVSSPSLTEKDYADLIFGLQNNVEWVALSFVRTAADVEEVQRIIRESGKTTKVIAKIEKPQAVKNMDAIIRVSDGIMVARGDLGVEMPMEEVPIIQKELVRRANQYAKPVIVATQMLESMIENPRPTRAETNDVANAVTDGADAVMLSAESAAGQYPILAVQAMSRIIRSVEEKLDSIYDRTWELDQTSATHNSDSVLAAACSLAKESGARAILAITSSGYSASYVSRHRPKADIFIFSRHRELLHRLNLLWGVSAFYYERNNENNTDQTIAEMENTLVQAGKLKKGDHYVVIASIPLQARGRANMLKLATVA